MKENEMENINDGKWHVHNDTENPLHEKTVVKVIFDDGLASPSVTEQPSGLYHWGVDNTIICFRVIVEFKVPKEFWVTQAGGYLQVYKNKGDAEDYKQSNPSAVITPVREALEEDEE